LALTEIDRKLLKRCLEHQPGAWTDFVDRFMGLIYHVINHTADARSFGLQPDDVEDFCAEVFLQLVANNYAVLRHFRGQSSLATYLTVVSRRIVIRELVRRNFAEQLGHTRARHLSTLEAEISGGGVERRLADIEQIQKMINGLQEQEAEVVRRFHLEGKSYREISREMGIPENSVGPTLSRARLKMRHTAERTAS